MSERSLSGSCLVRLTLPFCPCEYLDSTVSEPCQGGVRSLQRPKHGAADDELYVICDGEPLAKVFL